MKSYLKYTRNWGLPYFLLAVLLYLSIYGVQYISDLNNTPLTLSRNFQTAFSETEKKAAESLIDLTSRFDSVKNIVLLTNGKSVEKENDEGIKIFIYNKDSLIYWSSNKALLPGSSVGKINEEHGVVRLKNGWYGFQSQRSGNYLFLVFYLIRNEYPFQNNFIQNKFSSRFNCPGAVYIETNKGQFPIYSEKGKYLFSLNFSQYSCKSVIPNTLLFLLFISGSLCLIYFIFLLYQAFNWFANRRNLMVLLFFTDIVLLRIFQYWLGFPMQLTQSELFSPALYSSSGILPSLGDFTINTLLIFVLSLVIYKNFSIRQMAGRYKEPLKLIVNTVCFLIALVLFHLVGYLIKDLVINSSIPLNLQNISGFKFESSYGLFIITFLLWSFWLLSTRIFNDIIHLEEKKSNLLTAAIIAGIVYGVFCWMVIGRIDYIIVFFFVFYFTACWYLTLKNQSFYSVQNLLIFLCFFAVYATFLLNQANDQKETEKRNLLAVTLSTRRNPVTEVLYEQLERKILADSIVQSFLTPESACGPNEQDSLLKYLKSQYFNDYWQKYSIQITVCDSVKELRIQPQGFLINCNKYFHEIVKNYGEETPLPNLFFLDYGFGKEYYLARLSLNHFHNNRKGQLSIIVEFNLLNVYPDPGYPGLLMDNKRMDLPNLSDYSYGLFQNGKLVHSVGSYNYRMELDQFKKYKAAIPFFTEDRMIHFQYSINATNSLLISKNEKAFLTIITPFSYLFILFAVLALFTTLIINFRGNIHIVPTSLRNRLHFSLLGVLLVTLLVIGVVQVINIININSEKNVANLKEKAYSIQVEVQHRYSRLQNIKGITKSDLEDFLIKLSNVFFTDINFYDQNGSLLASSRQQIFEEGLISEKMNPEAFEKMVTEKRSAFIHNESIGSMHFSSAYLPLYNEQNNLLGYINLPYFSRQDELKKEISSFLVTFVNIYILLILFGVFITILISNYITAPLSMLAGKMSRLRLGIVNEKIEWHHSDEIGQLVSEYNRMIGELEKSAKMLAESERESAWREMARQVAHEIKNPLTPMKLSAQHLQKAWNEKAPDIGERLVRFTRTLIEQIDTLSAIASDFSSFAKMPVIVNERIDLVELIHFVMAMYQDTSDIRYSFVSDVSAQYIWADRALMIRIFTNLLNNAVQAIGNSNDGLVSITLSAEEHYAVIKISDNGSGISAERRAKIFQPDFTTKTGGMGLGLAIVKGIVTGMKGEITFTSEEQKGTTFSIKLPKYVI